MAAGYYPTFKGKLLDWALEDGPPAALSLRLALCDENFAYNAAHDSLDDVAGVVYSDFEVPGVVWTGLGKMDAPDLNLGGLTPNDEFKALVLYWKFTGGTQLFLWTTESQGQPLPIQVLDETLGVRFASAGLFQL